MAGIGKGLFTVFFILMVIGTIIYLTFSTFFKSYYKLPKDIATLRERVEKVEKDNRDLREQMSKLRER